VSALTFAGLEAAIRASWSVETSEDPHEWTADWSTRGQCACTALVVRELLGGEILIASVLGPDGEPNGEGHAWNRLPSGLEIDLTLEQFRTGETLGEPVVTEPFGDGVGEAAALLGARVRARLGL
jgi:hypothetical protein